MTRRQRLLATLRGEPVDRPAVSLYEIGGHAVDPNDVDEFNVYNDPSWRPLLELAEERSDIIRIRHPVLQPTSENCRDDFFRTEQWSERRSHFAQTTVDVAGRRLTSLVRRDADIDTRWQLEHLLKDIEDLKAFLELPDEVFSYQADVSNLKIEDRSLGDKGIVMVDAGDPLLFAAEMFSMADFMVVAFTEQKLFHRLLEKFARHIQQRTESVARDFPGALWRICGAEYATEPYLPPHLFEEYEVRYTKPMVEAIHKHAGYARIHSHGRIRSALPLIMKMRPAATDPIEPPPSGDVQLSEVRRQYGKDLVLFGNLEIRDIVNMAPSEFKKVVEQALRDGTDGDGRGFVLMPSAAPSGRHVTPRTVTNYETMIRLASRWQG